METGKGGCAVAQDSLILVSQQSWRPSTVPPTQGPQGQALPLGLLQDPLDMIRFGEAREVKWTPPQGTFRS